VLVDRHDDDGSEQSDDRPQRWRNPQALAEVLTRIRRASRPRGSFNCRWSRVSQEAGGLSEPHRFSALGGPEFLVDVLHVRLDSGTADAELDADRSERSIRREESQDARLGRCQGNRRARRLRAPGVGLAGNGPRTIGRGSSVRHRPKWLISRISGAFARVDPVRGENPAMPRACRSAAASRGRCRRRRRPLRSTSKAELCSVFAGG
jgi:hypothetical protein